MKPLIVDTRISIVVWVAWVVYFQNYDWDTHPY